MPKILIGISILLMTFSFVVGFLNTRKLKTLRSELTVSISAREISDRARTVSERKLEAREADFAAAQRKSTAAEAKATSSETELVKTQTEKAEIEARLQASEDQVADLQKRVAEAAAAGAPGTPESGSPTELKAMLDQAKQQLEAAEQEKSLLLDQVKEAQNRVAAIEEEKKRREPGGNKLGVHGTVLAVNQAYNFVVLNMGDRQGVVANSEMLVMRHGAFIGKIRISSVEPTTSIGDIISNSLARGVQVQTGDTVVYAGSTKS